MATKVKIRVNGLVHNETAGLDTSLLYVLHNEPELQCGAYPRITAIQHAAGVMAKGGTSP
jgi:hypothetical protein